MKVDLVECVIAVKQFSADDFVFYPTLKYFSEVLFIVVFTLEYVSCEKLQISILRVVLISLLRRFEA